MTRAKLPEHQKELYEKILLNLVGLDRHKEIETENLLFGKNENRNVLLCKYDRHTQKFGRFHDYFEILYVLSGRCENTIGTEHFSMSAGSLCFIAPYINHSSEVVDNGVVIRISIRKTTFEKVFFNFLVSPNRLSDFFISNLYPEDPTEYVVFNLCPDTELLECILSMLVEQINNDESSACITDNLVSMFFFLMVRKSQKNAASLSGGDDASKRQYISYIAEKFRTATLQDMANHFKISLAHCSRLVKSLAGKNFSELVRDIRLRHARALLASTNIKIYDISYSLGYKNQETFSRSFKKAFGCSPGQYRNKSFEEDSPDPATSKTFTPPAP